jgi:hypothetical protein
MKKLKLKMLGLLLVLAMCMGCPRNASKNEVVPTFNIPSQSALTAPIEAAKANINIAKTYVEKSIPLSLEPTKSYLQIADESIAASKKNLDQFTIEKDKYITKLEAEKAQQEIYQAKLRNNINDLTEQKATLVNKLEQSELKYTNSWFAGKTWRAIYWVVSIAGIYLLIDAALFIFTKSSTLNPLTIIGKLFKRPAE